MPNHVTNSLRITNADPEQLSAFWKSISGESPCLIDFNRIVPMPQNLMIESGSRTNEAIKIYTATKKGTPLTAEQERELQNDEKLLELGKRAYENQRDYGHMSWYDWNRENWGTKWNAYEQMRVDENTIEFLTAWNGVPDLMRKLSEQNPDLYFEYMYADEDWSCNVGKYEFQNGDTIYANEPEDMSEEAEEIACELLGNYDDEEEL